MRLMIPFILFFATPLTAEELPKPINRTILVLYDSKNGVFEQGESLNVEAYAEMPLNHLGLKIEKFDISKGLPSYSAYPDLRGIIIWPNGFMHSDDPKTLLKGIQEQMDLGVKFVTMGLFGFIESNLDEQQKIQTEVDVIYNSLGVNPLHRRIKGSYSYQVVHKNPLLVAFERSYAGISADFEMLEMVEGGGAESELLIQDPRKSSKTLVWVATHPNGGVVVNRMAVFQDPTGRMDVRRWLINPFLFFRKAFATDDLPKPDTTTLFGNRIYYSHVDGDGWYNVTYVPPYTEQKKLSPEVLYEEIYKAYPDLPVTIGVIAAEIDRSWLGKTAGIEITKKIFDLPNVEVGDHTFSHPFYWQFFEHYTQAKEKPYLRYYSDGGWDDFSTYSLFGLNRVEEPQKGDLSELPKGYTIPRAFAKEPFNLHLETIGSIEKINQIAPPGKKVSLYQWSGDTRPFAAAIDLLDKGDMPNINGGDTRFDSRFPSYGWVAPIGRLVDGRRQIYASNSNENTYTDLWTNNFFGFKELPQTLYNTEVPVRIKPINIYYHAYSGEKISSLEALKQNMEYAKTQPIIPIHASQFSKIAHSFYEVEIIPIEENIFEIRNRGYLQTIRFDGHIGRGIDWEKSWGVIGQKHLHGSLYVFLDDEVEKPRIAIQAVEQIDEEPAAKVPYLIKSNWQISHFKRGEESFSFTAHGFGRGAILFHVPEDGLYQVQYGKHVLQKLYTTRRELFLVIPEQNDQNVVINVKKIGEPHAKE